jgi:hypothetical protein
MGNNKSILLVHRNIHPYTADALVDVMLTPQFYMVKKEKIPIRTRYRAQRIAPSLFEGLLEKSTEYKFFVYPEDDEWVFIAYDPEEITGFLQEKGLGKEKAGKVYFAEQIRKSLHKPILLGEKEVMTLLDNTVVVVPTSAIAGEIEGSPPPLSRPKRSVSFEYADKTLLNREQAMVLAAVFVLFGLIWFAEGLRYQKNNRYLQMKTEELYTKYPSLQSRYTRDSILSKYRKVDTAERKKREIVGKVAGLIFKGVTIDSFVMDDKHYKVVFSVKDKKVVKQLEKLLKTAGLKKKEGSVYPQIIVKGRV